MKNKCNEKQCCCKCDNQTELVKHPGNIVYKGSISESTNMYACVIYLGEEKIGILYEKKHGECELFTPIKETIDIEIDYKEKYEKCLSVINKFDSGIIGMYDL